MAMQIIQAGKNEPTMLTEGAPEQAERKIAQSAVMRTDNGCLIRVILLALAEPREFAGWLPEAGSAADCRSQIRD